MARKVDHNVQGGTDEPAQDLGWTPRSRNGCCPRGSTGMALLALSACASNSPVPVDAKSRAALAIEQAEEAGAAEHAPLALRSARQNFERGEQLIASEKNQEALYAMQRAEADAQKAENVAEAEKTSALALEAEQSIETLNNELRREERGNE